MKLFSLISLLWLLLCGQSFAEETYVNQFKLFNDFDKFISLEKNDYASSYEIILQDNASFYDNKKFEGKPEFEIRNKKLYHREKLICDINKNGEVVPVNEDRPSNLTDRQKEMTLCIYLPFVYYKSYYPSDIKNDFSLRVLTELDNLSAIKYKNVTYYRARAEYFEEGDEAFVTPTFVIKEIKQNREELFKNEKFKSGYEEILACGLKKELDCLKKYLVTENKKDSLDKAKKIYGLIDLEKDVDLIYIAQKWASVFDQEDYYSARYKELRKKLSLRELHRKMFVDYFARVIKVIPMTDFLCTKKFLERGITYTFLNEGMREDVNIKLNSQGEVNLNYVFGQYDDGMDDYFDSFWLKDLRK